MFQTQYNSSEKLPVSLDDSFNSLGKFFELKWEQDRPQLVLLDTRAQIDELKGYSTEPWVVGWADGVKAVYVLRQEATGIESEYHLTDEKYADLIAHELCHCFWYYTTKGVGDIAVWLNEGIAVYTSGQLAYHNPITRFSCFLDNVYSESGYAEVGSLVQLLLKLRPKSTLLELVRYIGSRPTQTDLAAYFAKLYGVELSYAALNAVM